MSQYTCLVAIDLFSISGKQIHDILNAQISPNHFKRHLPEYCIRNNDKIGRTEYYLQYVSSDDIKYLVFDIRFIEEPLAEEISNIGWDDLELNFGFLKYLPKIEWDGIPRLPLSSFFLIDVSYESSYDYHSGATEYEPFYSIVGYLDTNKNIKPIEE